MIDCLAATRRGAFFATRPEDLKMTTLLQQAFAEAAKLPDDEQELLASRLLAELAVEDDFDRAIAKSSHKLANLARAAIEENRQGLTEPLRTDEL